MLPNYLVIDEIVNINIETASITTNPYAHRKFGMITTFALQPANGYVLCTNASDVDGAGINPTATAYIKKWFNLGGKSLYVIDGAYTTTSATKKTTTDKDSKIKPDLRVVNQALVDLLNTIPAFNILLFNGNNANTSVEQMDLYETIKDAKNKYWYINGKTAEGQAPFTSLEGNRRVSVMIDDFADGRWFNYLVGYEIPQNWVQENHLITTLPSDDKLGLNYNYPNLQATLEAYKVGGIYNFGYDNTNRFYYVYSKQNLPVRLNFLLEDITNSQQLAAAKFILDNNPLPPTDSTVSKIVGVLEEDMKNYMGDTGSGQILSFKVLSTPASQQVDIKNGITTGYKTTYRTFINVRRMNLGIKEEI